MLKKLRLLFMVVAALGVASSLVLAQSSLLSPDELDKLLAPIALYPDPLLAQIFPAASHPKQIATAYQYVSSKQDPNQIDAQPWDPSVQALAHYPDILKMMNDKPDWTARLGQAYTAQPSDVFASVQRLRSKAQSAGNLQTTTQQVVASDNNVITVMPADPQTIYVPQYSPEVVYSQPAVNVVTPLVTFGAGFALGGWIHNEVNWGGNSVYYHQSGWSSSYSYGWSSSYHSGWSSSSNYHRESSSSSSYHRSSSSSSSSGYHRGWNSNSGSRSGYHSARSSNSHSRSGYHNEHSGSRSGYHSARSSNSGSHARQNESHREDHREGGDRHRSDHNRGGHRGGGHHGGGHHGGGHR